MKSDKGVTLIALVIYIAVFTIVVSTMGLLSSYFYNNMHLIKDDASYVVEYNKFNMFFIQDVKHNSTATIENNVIKFEDGTIYEYKSNSIYRNDKEIAANVKSATFDLKTYKVENTTKNLILVNLNIGEGEKEYQKEIEYVLRYW